MVTVYRYNTAHPHREIQELMANAPADNDIKLNYVEWPQCCHMAWIGEVQFCTERDLARAMVHNDNGYVATFLCSIRPIKEKLVGKIDPSRILKELGWRKITDIPGPESKYPTAHGSDMEIWMYSMVEHGTYRRLHEVLWEYGPFDTKPVPIGFSYDENVDFADEDIEDEEEGL